MWPIVLAFGALGAILAVATSSKARAAEGEAPSPALPPVVPAFPPAILPPAIPLVAPPAILPVAPPVVPPLIVTPPTAKPPPSKIITTKDEREVVAVVVVKPACSVEELAFVQNVIKAIAGGTATLDMAEKALPLSLKCFPQGATILSSYITKERLPKVLVPVKKAAKIPTIVTEPDRPGKPIPEINGKAAWMVTVRSGMIMAIPNFKTSLIVFKELQKAAGAKEDGRIGTGTLKAFMREMKKRGFTKYPKSIAALAANAVKYTHVLEKKYLPAQIGALGGSRNRLPFY